MTELKNKNTACRVIYGCNDAEFEVAGLPVAMIHRSLQTPFNMPPIVWAVLHTSGSAPVRPVAGMYRLLPGDTLEFFWPWGFKGGDLRPEPNVPAGSPRWVTEELIAYTIRVWQPFYAEPLTPEDALTMIVDVSRLHDLLRGDGR